MAAGKRPVPFRTRKLSPPAPMVLPPGGSGRVGYRRPNNFTHSTRHTNPLCGGCLCFLCCRLAGARIADNTTSTHHWSGPTNRLAAAGAAVKPDNRVPRPGETQSESDPLVNFYENTPPEAPVWTPHCGQPRPHQQLVCTHELYESTKQSLRRSIDLGKRGPAVDSCTTGTQHDVLVAPKRLRTPHCGQRRVHQQWVDTQGL